MYTGESILFNACKSINTNTDPLLLKNMLEEENLFTQLDPAFLIETEGLSKRQALFICVLPI